MKSQSTLTLYIYNGVEHEWDFITSLKTKKRQKIAIRSSENLADTYLFANPDTTCIFVSPLRLDNQFVRYAEQLLNSSFTVVVPAARSHSLSHNLSRDKKSIALITKMARNFGGRITLKSYSSSLGIHEVVKALRNNHIRVSIPEITPKSKQPCVSYFGSKSGFRKEFDVFMPKGYICHSPHEALQKAEELYNFSSTGIVCKTDRGCAGEGVHIFRKKSAFEKVKTELEIVFNRQPYWNTHPIVIEEYVKPAMNHCPFPSIEGFIDAKGKLSFPYYCNMIVTPKGEFFGVEIHKNVLSSRLVKQLLHISTIIGSRYAQFGYRGTFDIDFLHDGKKLYANESNMRTNGGTDTYITAKKLIGDNFFTSRYVLSNYFSFSKHKRYTFERLKNNLEEYKYDYQTKIGVVVGSALALRQYGFSYMIIAHSAQEAQSIQKRIILTIKKNQE